MYRNFKIELNEVAILYKANIPVKVLYTGSYWYIDPLLKYKCEIYSVTGYKVERKNFDLMYAKYADVFKEEVEVIDTEEYQVGLITIDGKMREIQEPGKKQYFWKKFLPVEFRVIDISEDFQLEDKLHSWLGKNSQTGTSEIKNIKDILYVEVKENHRGILTSNGKVIKELAPGTYSFWRYNREVLAFIVDSRIQNVEVTGQDILSKDKVSVRVNLSANYRIVDLMKVFENLPSYKEYLYKELQFGIREVVGKKTIDEFLEDKDSISKDIETFIKERTREYGIKIKDVGIKDLILPGEMRDILNKVVEAQKVAEANVIKRREETAATRSLHNTAKMLENNPTLMRLKELETLEKITEKVDKLSVHNGLQGIMEGLISIKN